jgi:hypothetical protein
MTEYPNHPGFDARDCPLRRHVTHRRTDGGSGGYGCDYTGGHCLPGSYCSDRQFEAEVESDRRADFERLIAEGRTT